MAGACSQYNTCVSYAHRLITNYVKIEQNVIQRPNCISFFGKLLGLKIMSATNTLRVNSSTLISLNIPGKQRRHRVKLPTRWGCDFELDTYLSVNIQLKSTKSPKFAVFRYKNDNTQHFTSVFPLNGLEKRL